MSHLQSLFEGAELSEEFKQKAEVIFATAIEEKVAEAKTEFEKELTEKFEADLMTKVEELEEASKVYIQEEVMPSVDKYLSAAVQEWTTENKLALESTAKVALAESFLTGLVGLAESHNFVLPEAQDPTIALQAKVDELSEQSKELLETNIELQKENLEFKKAEIVAKVTESLSENQKEKFAPVIANVQFKTAEQYTDALKDLAESYFPKEANPEGIAENTGVEKKVEPVINEKKLSAEDLYYQNFGKMLKS